MIEKTPRKLHPMTLRMDAALYERLCEYTDSAGKGLPRKEKPTLTGIILRCIAQLLESNSTNPTQAKPQDEPRSTYISHTKTQEERLYIEKLLTVLRSGDKLTRRAIKSNLDVFSRLSEKTHEGDPVSTRDAAATIAQEVEGVREAQNSVVRMEKDDPPGTEADTDIKTPPKTGGGSL